MCKIEKSNPSSSISVESLYTYISRSLKYSPTGIAKMTRNAMNLRMPIRRYGRRIRNRPARRARIYYADAGGSRSRESASNNPRAFSLMRLSGNRAASNGLKSFPLGPPRSSPARGPPSACGPCVQPHSLSFTGTERRTRHLA